MNEVELMNTWLNEAFLPTGQDTVPFVTAEDATPASVLRKLISSYNQLLVENRRLRGDVDELRHALEVRRTQPVAWVRQDSLEFLNRDNQEKDGYVATNLFRMNDSEYANGNELVPVFTAVNALLPMPDDVRQQWEFIRDMLSAHWNYQDRIGKFVAWTKGTLE